LKTLQIRQIISGFAEIIKHTIIADRKLFDSLSNITISKLNDEKWVQIIARSIRIKKEIVEQDEEEKNGIRKQLNFGHTVGHAIESLSLKTNNPILHGEAVAIGMLAETRMSCLAGHISRNDEKEIITTLTQCELPTHISGIPVSEIQNKICTDKKNTQEKILWSLPLRIGKVESDIILNPDVIKNGILSIIK
jgi:3-dehydroquinate synthase